MKTKTDKGLTFNKNVVTELNSTLLGKIYGGTGTGYEDDDLHTRWTSDLCNSGIMKNLGN